MTRQIKSTTHDAQKLRAQAERARRAATIVEDPIFIEALDAIDRVIEEGWKQSSAEDRQARDNAYMLHRLLTNLRGHFKAILVNGNNARALLQLEEIKSGGENSS
jgi:hypothetical protein